MGVVDFRYYPMEKIQIYQWSEGLKRIKVKNEGDDDITVVGIGRRSVCKKGEITVVEKKERLPRY